MMSEKRTRQCGTYGLAILICVLSAVIYQVSLSHGWRSRPVKNQVDFIGTHRILHIRARFARSTRGSRLLQISSVRTL